MQDQNDTNATLPPVDPTVSATGQDVGAPAPIIPDEAITAPADAAPVVAEQAAPVSNPAPTTSSPSSTDSTAMEPDLITTDAMPPADNTGMINEVATKIGESHNILVALSSDPSVDELCSAIGLSLFLGRLGKRVTAIYSGATPNALEFLNPEETFEQSADTLQDFVIALNKEKADHLRYKLDGDYVKIFITPYRSRISNEDLEFSYGDYNVDLVLALDVANGVDLDAALREHGRIMHDATVINITTGNPGKLGEIEWSDKSASSISEMIAELLYNAGGQNKIEKEEATAFLTGIVAATNRFATASTTSRTMELASRLMESGANQQLISKNITSDMENEFFSPMSSTRKTPEDPTKLDIAHGNEQNADEEKEVETAVSEKESTLLDDLKAAEASLAASVSGVVTPEEKAEPLKLTNEPSIEDSLKDFSSPENLAAPTEVATEIPTEVPTETLDNVDVSEPHIDTPAMSAPTPEPENNIELDNVTLPETPLNNEPETPQPTPEKVIAPPSDFVPEPLGKETNRYGQMLEDALAESNMSSINPATSVTPDAPTEPEINGVPDINYMPMPGDETLPPPPTPPIDFNDTNMAEPVTAGEPEPIMPPTPAMPEAYTPQEPLIQEPSQPLSTPANAPAPQTEPISDPAAFKIPGM